MSNIFQLHPKLINKKINDQWTQFIKEYGPKLSANEQSAAYAGFLDGAQLGISMVLSDLSSALEQDVSFKDIETYLKSIKPESNIKTRTQKFMSFYDHPRHKKLLAQLSSDEVKECLDFIVANDALDAGTFELKVNRLFVDKTKPKHFTAILDLLACCNG